MGHIFENTLNTRPIFENSLKFIRSDVPIRISETERKWLIEKRITTIIDLRTEEEKAKKVCPLMHDSRFEYYCMPVTGGDAIPASCDEVPKSYISMVDAKLYDIITFMLNAKTNVLYFCNAGKDRTGVISAVLLYKSGLKLDYIVDDYMKSKTNLKSMLDNFAKQNPTINIDVITPHERYIEEFLEWLAENGIR